MEIIRKKLFRCEACQQPVVSVTLVTDITQQILACEKKNYTCKECGDEVSQKGPLSRQMY